MHEATPLCSLPLRGHGRRTVYDAIAIGTGVGGAVAAGLLAHHGRRVLCVEKNPVPGGILAAYARSGFKVDAGSHLIAHGAAGPLARALRRAGCPGVRFLTHPIPVRSRGIFEATAPRGRGGLVRAGLEAARRLGVRGRELVRLCRMVARIATMGEATLRQWDRRTLDAFVREHTEHPGVYFLLSFLGSIFFVLPPWEVSAGEALRALRSLLVTYRLSYVEGGMDAIPRALFGRVLRAGGEVVVGRRVVGVGRAGPRLQVSTDDGRVYEAPVVIANVAPACLLPLLDGLEVPPRWAARVAALRPAGGRIRSR